MAEKWYDSEFAKELVKPIGVALIFASFGLGMAAAVRGCKGYDAYLSLTKQVEMQRLQTIEEFTRQYGSRMEPNELSNFLKEHNLDR